MSCTPFSISSSPTSSMLSSSSSSPATYARRPSHLGLWNPADQAMFSTLEKQPRSLSIRTAEGQRVSILNDDSDSGSECGSRYTQSDSGLCLSIPLPSPKHTSLHCMRRTHSSIGMSLPSPQMTPTRLPSLSALVEAATMVNNANEMSMLPPPCTQTYAQSHCLHLHSHQASAPAYSQVVPRTQSKRKYHCSYPSCGKAFTTSGHLSRHFRIHTGEKNYQCLHPGCTSRFSRQDNMMQHYRTHLSPRSRRNRMMRTASEYTSAFSPYKRSFVQHSPSAPSQWSFF